jgi:hypothetical protein
VIRHIAYLISSLIPALLVGKAAATDVDVIARVLYYGI